MTSGASSDGRLLAVKVLHTVVWAFFAGCIVAIPWVAYRGRLGAAAVLCAVVFVEVLVLAFNGWRCPLTGNRPLTFRQAVIRWACGLVTVALAGLPALLSLSGSSLADRASGSATLSRR